mgnify:CR=1 FL=1
MNNPTKDEGVGMEMDLNLDNYTFQDILNLFELRVLYTIEDLRAAKRIVANTHPDKSSLPTEYFIFFKTAYQLLINIYRQRERKERTLEMLETERYNTYDESNHNESNHNESNHNESNHNNVSKDKFNNWFNRMFDESVDSTIGASDDGYGKWLKESNINEQNTTKTFQEMEHVIHAQKKQSCIVVVDDIHEYGFGSTTGYSELGTGTNTHGGLLSTGSNIRFDDLKRAYTESIIPVEEATIMARRTNHKDVNSLVKERGDLPDILDRNVSEKMLMKKRNIESEDDTYRLYELAKEEDRAERIQKSWKANLLRIGF